MSKTPMNVIVFFCFFLSFFTTTANALEGDSVQDMIQQCQQDDPKFLHCVGMGSGVSVMMMLNSKTVGSYRFCSSRGLSNGQIIRIFLNWADRNPKDWDAPGPIGFALALGEAYPCN